MGAELVKLAEARGGIGHLAEALNSLSWSQMYAGDFELAAAGLDRAWEGLESLAIQTADRAPQSPEQISEARNIRRLGSLQNNRSVSGWNLWFLGYPDRALKRIGIRRAFLRHKGNHKRFEIDRYALHRSAIT